MESDPEKVSSKLNRSYTSSWTVRYFFLNVLRMEPFVTLFHGCWPMITIVTMSSILDITSYNSLQVLQIMDNFTRND